MIIRLLHQRYSGSCHVTLRSSSSNQQLAACEFFFVKKLVVIITERKGSLKTVRTWPLLAADGCWAGTRRASWLATRAQDNAPMFLFLFFFLLATTAGAPAHPTSFSPLHPLLLLLVSSAIRDGTHQLGTNSNPDFLYRWFRHILRVL